jgi:hypothetical protein
MTIGRHGQVFTGWSRLIVHRPQQTGRKYDEPEDACNKHVEHKSDDSAHEMPKKQAVPEQFSPWTYGHLLIERAA